MSRFDLRMPLVTSCGDWSHSTTSMRLDVLLTVGGWQSGLLILRSPFLDKLWIKSNWHLQRKQQLSLRKWKTMEIQRIQFGAQDAKAFFLETLQESKCSEIKHCLYGSTQQSFTKPQAKLLFHHKQTSWAINEGSKRGLSPQSLTELKPIPSNGT